ncbi:phage tail tip lysozyme [Novacetimonas pomaceti]|uniref:phage tail tip lysozyme n=1 Tax=Novacetimonas pomaceti TaxID=2021998 RepID=UPI001C2CE21D|nr:phage tail tip lysozyme [Novacetimonas pomaceti]MBV1833080.1 hypothetical protein [Novacetimonas pomaceti]
MAEDFLFGLKFDFDPSGFLRGSAEAQDQLERTVAGIAHAREQAQQQVEAMAAALSRSPQEIKAALADLERAQRDHQTNQERQARIAERRQVERHRTEMEMLRSRTQAVTSLRDAMLSVAAITIGERGMAGVASLLTNTSDRGVAEGMFAQRTHTNMRQNLAEEEGAYLSGMSTREEARASIQAYSNAQNQYKQTGHSSATDALIRAGIQITPDFFSMGHEAALRNVVQQMQRLGYTQQSQTWYLEQSGLTSGGYTNLALDPDQMRRFNRQGMERAGHLADNERQDLQFRQAWNNMMSDVDTFRSDISHTLEPWVGNLDGLVKELDHLATENPELPRNVVAVTAVIVAMGGMFSALMPVIGTLMTMRAIVGVAGAGTAAGGAGAAAGAAASGGMLARIGGMLGMAGPIGALLGAGGFAAYEGYEAIGDVRNAYWSVQARKSISPYQQSANRDAAEKYWLSQGYSRDQVSALAARFHPESKFDPTAVGDNGAAYGIGQWHGDRQANYTNLFGHTMQSVTDRQQALREQLQFSQWELTHTENNAGNALRAAGDYQSASQVVSRQYIRPGVTDAAKAQEAWRTRWQADQFMQRDRLLAPPGAGAVTHNNASTDNSTHIHVDQVHVKADNPQQLAQQLSNSTPNPHASTVNSGQH